MERQTRIQDLVQQILAEVVNKKLTIEGYMVTVTGVELSPDQKRLSADISVLPDKYYGTALKAVRKLSGFVRGEVARRAKLRETPKVYWRIDPREKRAAELEPLFRQIEEENK